MTERQRATFERNGFLVVPGVLSADEVAHYAAVVDRIYARRRADGRVAPDGSLHELGVATNHPELVDLVDHPRAFPLVWSVLGWNTHVYHSHLDVHPPLGGPRPFRFEWHQDGGRQNRELETDPRPRLSVKLAYWLSDVSRPGRGNFRVVPGSHTTNWIAGPPRRTVEWPDPQGAIEVTAQPGDAVFFDRRIWHARSDNHSTLTRKAVFFAYTYRWIATRDPVPADRSRLSPVQWQLVGGVPADHGEPGDHAWGHFPEQVPLYLHLRETNQLRDDYPPLRP